MSFKLTSPSWKPSSNPLYAEQAFPGVKELFFVGFRKFHSAQTLPMHTHPGWMEITYLAAGSLTWCVEGEQRVDLSGGNLYCTWPGERHGGVDGVWQPCEMYWILIELPRVMPEGYLGIPATEAQTLHQRLWRLQSRKFTGPTALIGHFRRLCDLVGQSDASSQLAARSALLHILLETCRCSQQPSMEGLLSPPILNAVKIMKRWIERPRSLPDIAREVGMSTSHFSRLFKKETGLAPGDYYIRCRVNAARKFITTTDLSLAEIANRCGFGTGQYLATCFRRVTGRSPSSFRNG